MGKWFGAIAALAMVATAAGPGAGLASAGDMPGGAGVSPAMDMGATCSPAGTSLALTAQDHKFDKDCLAVPAGQTFTIRFDNKDSDRHNVAILPSHTSTETLFQGDIVPGPKSITYSVPALKAGTFHFHCQVHPNLMNGVFIVGTAAAAPAPAPTPAPAAKPAPTPQPNTSMGADKPAAQPAPTPKTAEAMPAMPAPAPKAPAATTPAPARTAAGASSSPKTAGAAKGTLPHTGPRSARLLLLLAGIAFAIGGLSVVGGARRAEVLNRP